MRLDWISDAIDAVEPYDIVVSPWSMRHCKQRDPSRCAGVLTAKHNDPNIEDIKIYLTRMFIKFRDQPLPLRYDNDFKLQKLARANDLKGMRGVACLLRLFKIYGEAFVVRGLPPRHATSLEYLRSPERRKIHNASAARSARKPKSERRKYTSPNAKGLRNGQGLAHSWELNL